MTTIYALPPRTTAELADVLFDGQAHRRSFIREELTCVDPSRYDEIAVAEQQPALGPVLLDADFAYDPDTGFYRRRADLIRAACVFIAAAEIDSKRRAAIAWAKSMAARDIQPLVIIYTLNRQQTDFASLAKLAPRWLPDEIGDGSRFRYKGRAYALPSRSIALAVCGEFEIVETAADDDGVLWFEVSDLDSQEHVFLTMPLLLAARFNDR